MRVNKIFIKFSRVSLVCIAILHISCANTTDIAHIDTQATREAIIKDTNDFAMLQAADFMNQGLFSEAIAVYKKLYKQTQDVYFLKQVALAQSQAGELDSAVQTAQQYQTLSKDVDDSDTNLIIAEDHVRKKQYNLAIILLEKNIAINPNLQTHYILSNLYLQQRMPKKALPHFISIYNDEMSAGTKLKLEALNQIVSIYLQSKEIDNALRYLNAYIASNEYSINLQNFFALYAKTNRLDMLEENLKKRFLDDQSIENARMLVSVFVQLKHYEKAITLLKEYDNILGVDGQEMLMQVYVEDKAFQEAMQLAKQLYKQTNRIELLGLSAIYEYEATAHKNKKNLQPIISTLRTMLTLRTKELKNANQNLTKDDAFFYNFLGYLMINHDINIDEGMQYVSKALAIEPTSIEYLDSLAWGFYKKGDCKQAQETFNLIATDKIETNPELIEHSTAIKTCK